MRTLILLTASLATSFSLWSQTPAPRPADATLAAQTIGRMAFFPDGTVEVYGYYSFLQGFGAEGGSILFNGAVNTRNARLTFRTERSTFDFIPNGSLTHAAARPLSSLGTQLSIYYDASPEQEFNKPETFSDGERIATYRIRDTRATIAFGAGANASLTLVLESSRDFTIGDTSYNLRSLGDQMAVNIVVSPTTNMEEFLRLRADGGLSLPLGGTGYSGTIRQ